MKYHEIQLTKGFMTVGFRPIHVLLTRVGLWLFFGSHTRTSHVQISVRTHTCVHLCFMVVALCTRTCTFCSYGILNAALKKTVENLEAILLSFELADLWDITFCTFSTMCTCCFETQSSPGCTCSRRYKFLTHSLKNDTYLLSMKIRSSK